MPTGEKLARYFQDPNTGQLVELCALLTYDYRTRIDQSITVEEPHQRLLGTIQRLHRQVNGSEIIVSLGILLYPSGVYTALQINLDPHKNPFFLTYYSSEHSKTVDVGQIIFIQNDYRGLVTKVVIFPAETPLQEVKKKLIGIGSLEPYR